MKFLANENVPVSSVNYLKSKGYDITSIGVDEAGVSDQQVMDIATKQDRTIITYDSDYGELIFKYGFKPNAGVIFIRQQPTEPLETAKIIEQLTSNTTLSFERTLTVVDLNSLRQKKY
ncbi:DUF5615 family PIN-like protein [Marinoscillum sp. 108]|uniref:DUF5615 family PIN-like protein n=1 Tax=Marinoscillum sp. 108 TaxID=2653151 RepID=UPI0012EFFB95|nr:DUF5615 family PIN-like protein [Marinoscillum sp. 108]VXD10535.1 conserved hypothetical protein [Marinoscillum sp. 108]